MAKSKSGGTRSMIRGRVGSDVYSIGKTASGKKQQVVRSIAETVANPQTIAQMRGRMIMSTIMQAQSALKPIIDHSFDNVIGVQPNLSEFISRNYALIKADVAANPSSDNTFGLNAYQEKGAKQGAYVISDGKAAVPAALTINKASGVITIAFGSDALTMANLKSKLGLGNEEFFTLVGIDTAGAAEFCRYHINQSLADDTVISSANVDTIFEVDGNCSPTVAVSGSNITITLAAVANCCAVIVTKKDANGFKHSKATLGAGTGLSWNADAALPTYPVGDNKFLNGGDQSFSPAPAPSPTPTPSVSAPTISGTTPFETSTSVTMSAESGAEIRYTTDGSTPTSSSSLYSSAITLTDTATVKAIAIKDGVSSTVAQKTFTKSAQPAGDRSFTVNGSAVAEGGTSSQMANSQAAIVATLPAGDSTIGQYLMYKVDSGAATVMSETAIAEGANNGTIPANKMTSGSTVHVGYGHWDALGQYATWGGEFFTIQVASF